MASSKKAPAKKAAAPKAAAKKTAKKTAAAKKAPADGAGRPGRKPAFTDDAKISILSKENPKRAKAAERFNLYKEGMTVGKYIEAGGTRADVRWDAKQGFIKLSAAA